MKKLIGTAILIILAMTVHAGYTEGTELLFTVIR
jgi:hypothetical protein